MNYNNIMDKYIKKYYYNYNDLIKKYHKKQCEYKILDLLDFIMSIWDHYPQLYYKYILKIDEYLNFIVIFNNNIRYSLNCGIDIIYYQHIHKYMLFISYCDSKKNLEIYRETINLILFTLDHILTI